MTVLGPFLARREAEVFTEARGRPAVLPVVEELWLVAVGNTSSARQ